MSGSGATPFSDLTADQKRAMTACHSLVTDEMNNTGLLERNPSFHLADPASATVYGTTVWFEALGLKTYSIRGLQSMLAQRNKNLDIAVADDSGGGQKIYVTLDFADYARRVSKSTGPNMSQIVYQLIIVLILCTAIAITFQSISS